MSTHLKDMTDDELKAALQTVAGPIIMELSARGYEVSVVRLTVHTSDEPGKSTTQRLSPRQRKCD